MEIPRIDGEEYKMEILVISESPGNKASKV
jgi:hypothetical protein